MYDYGTAGRYPCSTTPVLQFLLCITLRLLHKKTLYHIVIKLDLARVSMV